MLSIIILIEINIFSLEKIVGELHSKRNLQKYIGPFKYNFLSEVFLALLYSKSIKADC